MASLKLRHLSNSQVLKKMDPRLLQQLLNRHRGYLVDRGLEALNTDGDIDIDYEKLAYILLTPTLETPTEFARALNAVDELATPKGQECMESILGKAPLFPELGPQATAADVAVYCWLNDQRAVRCALAELRISRKRSFVYFQASQYPPRAINWTEESRQSLEAELETWFVEHRKGRGVRITSGNMDDEIWFEVRRGDSFHREGSLENGESKTILFRPEKFDVLVYSPATGSLRANVRLVGEKNLYRQQFGKHLFGQEDYFTESGRYSLEPLLRNRESSLSCEDIDDIQRVVLRELTLYWPGDLKKEKVLKAVDVFEAYPELKVRFPKGASATRAVLELHFSNNETSRKVTLSPPDRVTVSHDGDSSVVDEWLVKRNFAAVPAGVSDETP